jgi:hypothetical protein
MRLHRTFMLVTAVTAVTAVAAGMTSASSTAQTAQHTATIHVVQTNSAVFTNVDVGPAGDSIGDYVVITGPIVRPGSRTILGSTAVVCTSLKTATTGPLQCLGTSHLAAGDITIQGLFITETGRHNRLAVTGGTGAYQRARGEFVATILNDGSTDGFFRLTLQP